MKSPIHYLILCATLVTGFFATDTIQAGTEEQRKPIEVRLVKRDPEFLEKLIYMAILKLALEKSDQPYTIEITDTPVTTPIERLEDLKKPYNLRWDAADPSLEKLRRPIRIPLLLGLLGNRVFFIRTDDQPKFSAVKSLEDLANLRSLVVKSWGNVPILEHAGLSMVFGQYDNLISMLKSGRGDYFSRSVLEILIEADTRNDPDLAIEETILLKYLLPMFFWVSLDPDDDALYNAIEAGLIYAFKDGSYLKLLESHPQTKGILARLKLPERKVFEIENPFLSSETLEAMRKFYATYSVDTMIKHLLANANAGKTHSH